MSVIIPAFRAADLIKGAVDSALAQKYLPSEVIVVNDASPDTVELEASLREYGQRIRYARCEVNRGPGGARNVGIRMAQGELLAFLDADDRWAPTFLAEQVAFLQHHPIVDLVYSDMVYVRGRSGSPASSLMKEAPSTGEVTFETLVRQECTVGTSSVVVKRRIVLDVGLFDEAIGNYGEDFDLYLRIARAGSKIGYQRKQLAIHRVHAASLTAQPTKGTEGLLRVLMKCRRTPDLTYEQEVILDESITKVTADLNLERAKLALSLAQFDKARDQVRAANMFYRSSKLRIIELALLCCPRVISYFYRMRYLRYERQFVADPGSATSGA